LGPPGEAYLPVSQPGALLYVGDGHAVQGDGELNGNALETSMDVELAVDVIARKSQMTPRVESATHIRTNHLTPSEIAIVLGSSVEYTVSEVADRNAGIVAKLRKDRLALK
jgi:acetamidase/formamidase